jgi:TetR/AcrR family transcriptional repressor of cmeABC operon
MSDSDKPGCTRPPSTARGQERQRRILCAAERVFLEQGVDNASLSAVIEEAGGSMSTLYRQFGSKLGLLEAVMQQNSNRLFATLDDESIWDDEIEATLTRFGQRYIEIINTPRAIGMYRLVLSANSAEREQIQRIFYHAGPRRVRTLVATYFERQKARGALQLTCCETAASHFIEMIRQPWHQYALLGVPYEDELPARALRQGIALFLHGALPR